MAGTESSYVQSPNGTSASNGQTDVDISTTSVVWTEIKEWLSTVTPMMDTLGLV